jgi:SAM-dependent methyltransferase
MKLTSQMKTLLRKSGLSLLYLLPGRFALKTLLKMDNWIYYLVGKEATHLNKGIHPKHRYLGYHDFFIKHIQSQERVLDIGCGNGVVALEIAQQTGAKVTGIDSEPTKIEEAKRRDTESIVNFITGDVLKNLPEGKFEVAILSNVLEHLPSRVDFLKSLVLAVQPSRLLIRVPLFDRDWRVPLKKELGVEWRLDPTHQIEYTLETFSSEMKAAHLAIDLIEVRWGEIWAKLHPDAL